MTKRKHNHKKWWGLFSPFCDKCRISPPKSNQRLRKEIADMVREYRLKIRRGLR